MHFEKISIIGVGLLGGSLGLALKERRLASRVSGFVRRPASVAECLARGAVDEATCDPVTAVQGADLVIFCTPLAQMAPLARQMAPAFKPGVLVTDVGSVKGGVVDDLEPILAAAGGQFVGSHPMAGAERTGVGAARSDLFSKAICVVTPTVRTPPDATRTVVHLWEALEMRVLTMPAAEHDALVSRSSHLPHVLAVQLVNLVLGPEQPPQQANLCATGFRDTTRIASGSTEMWRDIALANRENIADALEALVTGLGGFQRALRAGDAEALTRFFEQAKGRRDEWLRTTASVSTE